MEKSMKKRLGALVTIVTVLALAVSLIGGMGVFGASASAFSTERYTSDYSSKMEAILAGAELNERMAEEGMVLLKNENDALPLKVGGVGSDRTKVSLFGYKSVVPDGGSNGNDTENSVGVTKIATDIYSSLDKAGFKTNPVIKRVYNDYISTGVTSDFAGGAKMLASVKETEYSFAQYNDAAIVVLSATGAATTESGKNWAAFVKGEDGKPTTTLEGVDATVNGEHPHGRQIDKYQKDLLDFVCTKFDKVVVIINDSIPMELDYIQKHEGVDAILLAGNPGVSGFDAVGKILAGTVTPSGKLADIYPAKFVEDPTFANTVNNGVPGKTEDGTEIWGGVMGSAPVKTASGSQFVDENGNPRDAWFAMYKEGIYIGYRYYETADAEAKKGNYEGFDYDSAVTYPFGYGLSYTSFEWEPVGELTSAPAESKITSQNDKVTIAIKVTNTGAVAGKDVVQLYYTAPWAEGQVEKAEVVLADFAKTSLLAPGESEIVTVSVIASDMASYDSTNNGGYALDAGTYTLSVRESSHTVKNIGNTTTPFTADLQVETKIANIVSDQTGNKIENALQDSEDLLEKQIAKDTTDNKLMSRSNFAGTFPKSPSVAQRTLDAADYKLWDYKAREGGYDKTTDPWYVAADKMPKFVKEADAAARPEDGKITLDQMIGKSINDPNWDKLLDQLTLKEMSGLISNGGFGSNGIPYINKPQTHDTDGPAGWSGNGTGGAAATKFATNPTIACTFSKSLAYEEGVMIGEQALWGRSDTGVSVAPYSGWYGPAMNTHRSPFLPRYSEYYSEDGYLAGMMAGNAIIGAREKGCYATIKHFAFHEDGYTDRGVGNFTPTDSERGRVSGLSILATEQAMREIYLKPFQICVEEGDPMGAMSSFSRIGAVWAGGHYGLLTQILRNEWGFSGLVVTDIVIYDFVNANQAIRAGGDLMLSSGFLNKDIYNVLTATQLSAENIAATEAAVTASQVTAMRNATKNVLYAVANSNAMQVPLGAAVVYGEAEVGVGKVGASYTADIATAELNTKYAYSTISYAVTGGALPLGLDLDEETGEISGEPERAGTYTFTVTASADGYEPSSRTFTIEVDPAKSVEDAVGEKIDAGNAATKSELDKLNSEIGNLKSEIEALKKASEEDGGCGSSVATGSAIALAALVLIGFGAALVVKRRKSAAK